MALTFRTIATTLMLLASAYAGDSNGAQVRVGASVMPRVNLEVLHQAGELRISQADVERGYVELSSAARFQVRSNCAYLLEVHLLGGLVRSARVSGLAHPMEIGADGNQSMQRPMAQAGSLADLSFRFELPKDTRPGSYSWPVRVYVQPA